MATSFEVKSRNVYRGQPSEPEIRLFDKIEPSKSVLHSIPVGTFSYTFGEGPVYYRRGNNIYYRTSNNLFEFPLDGYGNFFNNDDRGMRGYKKAGEGVMPDMLGPIPRFSDIANVPGVAYIKGPLSRLHLPYEGDTKVPNAVSSREVIAIDMNKTGFAESRITKNLEEPIRSINRGGVYNFESQEWINSLGNKGFAFDKAGTAGIKGLGILYDTSGQGFTWGYFPNLGYLIAEANVHKKLERDAYGFGLTGNELREAIEAFKRGDIYHEIGHINGIKGDRKDERLQGLLKAAFFSDMVEKYKHNPRLARIYRAQIKEGLGYARGYSLGKKMLELILAEPNPGTLSPEEIFYKKVNAEADARELEGVERDAFINARYKETGFIKLLAGEPSYKNSGGNAQKQSTKSKGKTPEGDADLEEKVTSEESRLRLIKGGKNYENKSREEYDNEQNAPEKEAEPERNQDAKDKAAMQEAA